MFNAFRILFVLSLAILFSSGNQTIAETPQQWTKANLPAMTKFYQELHKSPELSFKEEKTSQRLAKELRALGVEVTEKVGGFGVVGVLKNGKGKTVMLRTDMDALPIVEETGLAFASKVKTEDRRGATVGVMHACGHDMHMTNLIGVARFLAKNKNAWQGTVVFICQPAEELGAGAKAMLEDGLFQRFPRPDYAIALHVTPLVPAGMIAYKSGYAMANVDSVDITFNGRGGHGAYPHSTIDPIVMASKFVLDVQTIVSREVKPIEPAVITVGSIRGGTKHNIIPNTCDLQLTVRSYRQAVRKQLISGIKRKAKAAATSAGAAEPTIKVSEGTPSLYNDLKLVGDLIPVFKKTIGEQNVIEGEPTMGGEDFSRYGLAGVPIFMYWVGAMEKTRFDEAIKANGQPPSLHSAGFYPDVELALPTAINSMASGVLKLLPKDKTE